MSDDHLTQLIRDGLEAVEPRNTIASGEADGIVDSIRAVVANARWAAFDGDELRDLWHILCVHFGGEEDLASRLADEIEREISRRDAAKAAEERRA